MIILLISILFVYLIFFYITSVTPLQKDFYNKKYMIIFFKLGRWFYRKIEKSKILKVKVANIGAINKYKLLNPSEDTILFHEKFYTEKIAYFLFMLFVGTVLSLVISINSELNKVSLENRIIERNTYGMGEKDIELDITLGENQFEGSFPITIQEQQYSDKELTDIFNDISQQLEQIILQDNDSLDVICYDLNLISKLPPYPIEITWKFNNYNVINGNGQIQKEATTKEGTPLEITAVLTYYDNQQEHIFNGMVYPPPEDEKESISIGIRELLEKYEKQTVHLKDMILPEEWNGNKLTFETKREYQDLFIFLVFLVGGVLIYYGKNKELDKKVEKREKQMKMDYPEIVCKMTLLLGAGMTIRGAFEKVAFDYERRKSSKNIRYAYEEMLFTTREMKGGISESDAYVRFGNRCKVQKYLKLGALLSQNLKKGSTGLLLIMESEEREAFEERKSLARKLGEEAGTKLLLPMGIMLLVVMIIIIVPAFLSFSL